MDGPHKRISTVLTPEKLDEVAKLFRKTLHTLLRKGRQAVGMTYGSMHRVMKQLQLTPYKFHATHKLLPADIDKRIA